VLESVREGGTGTYYASSDPAALADVVAAFDPLAIDPADCVAAAEGFGSDRFRTALRAIVDEAVAAESSADRQRSAVVTGLPPRRAARRAAARR
jgi:hypothetical protein